MVTDEPVHHRQHAFIDGGGMSSRRRFHFDVMLMTKAFTTESTLFTDGGVLIA